MSKNNLCKKVIVSLTTVTLLTGFLKQAPPSVLNAMPEKVSAAKKSSRTRRIKRVGTNSAVYVRKGKKLVKSKKIIKAGQKVRIYGQKTVKGKLFYRIGKNKFVKAVNIQGKIYQVTKDTVLYTRNGKKVKAIHKGQKIRIFGASKVIKGKKCYATSHGYIKRSVLAQINLAVKSTKQVIKTLSPAVNITNELAKSIDYNKTQTANTLVFNGSSMNNTPSNSFTPNVNKTTQGETNNNHINSASNANGAENPDKSEGTNDSNTAQNPHNANNLADASGANVIPEETETNDKNTSESKTPEDKVPDQPNTSDDAAQDTASDNLPDPIAINENVSDSYTKEFSPSKFRQVFLRELNQERVSRGLTKLTADPTYDKIVQERAQDLIKNFGLYDKSGTSILQKAFQEKGIDYPILGECIASFSWEWTINRTTNMLELALDGGSTEEVASSILYEYLNNNITRDGKYRDILLDPAARTIGLGAAFEKTTVYSAVVVMP
ncbi:SLAP domain-containing protein [uncultured Lactobacillus sp.]|uniref:SLAP domain-containing protein n=1 Tax=uncultured Lactobacillus sp. TaxID=153152 RepID=UPI0025EF91D7|nr:SLAP domain-containing protein [uncultured Lactobacillus sp.]